MLITMIRESSVEKGKKVFHKNSDMCVCVWKSSMRETLSVKRRENKAVNMIYPFDYHF